MKNAVSKISVCIPVYNGEETISKNLNSLIRQNYKNFEREILFYRKTQKLNLNITNIILIGNSVCHSIYIIDKYRKEFVNNVTLKNYLIKQLINNRNKCWSILSMNIIIIKLVKL